MKYEINCYLARLGLEETLKLKLNNLEVMMNEVNIGGVRTLVGEYYQARNLARDLEVDTSQYDNEMLKMSKELKDGFGVIIP